MNAMVNFATYLRGRWWAYVASILLAFPLYAAGLPPIVSGIAAAAVMSAVVFLVRSARDRALLRRITILELLRQNGPMSGADVRRRSSGALSRSSVYVCLADLEESGLVVRVEERVGAPSEPARWRYSLTEAGTRAAARGRSAIEMARS